MVVGLANTHVRNDWIIFTYSYWEPKRLWHNWHVSEDARHPVWLSPTSTKSSGQVTCHLHTTWQRKWSKVILPTPQFQMIYILEKRVVCFILNSKSLATSSGYFYFLFGTFRFLRRAGDSQDWVTSCCSSLTEVPPGFCCLADEHRNSVNSQWEATDWLTDVFI